MNLKSTFISSLALLAFVGTATAQDSTKSKKSCQNQEQFFDADKAASSYNYYDRKAVSQPLQPAYDLDSAAFQKGKKKEKQQAAFLNQKYYFPAKPKDKWEIGLNGGSAFLIAGLNARVRESFGVGIDVRKSLGYVFSIRGGYTFFSLKGAQNWTSGTQKYHTTAHEVHVEGIVNVGNILFHKERSKWGLYGLAGVSALFYQSRQDLDNNGKFETVVTRNIPSNKYFINKVGSQGYEVTPTLFFGAGVSFRPAKFMSISVEERVSAIHGQFVAGKAAWDDFSYMPYTQLRLGFFVGGKDRVEPLYWLNPVAYAYKKIGETNADKIAKDLQKDDDEDGVPNFLDKEPNTKKGYPVDVRGVALDSDKDGIVDGEDKEPFSPPGYPIDQNGVAQVPPPACCQNGAKKGGVSERGALPSVYFDNDKYYLDPAAEALLYTVAEKLQSDPDAKLVVTGYDASTNDRKYNEQLAYNRAMATVNHLVEKYGISRDRFIVKYVGEKANPKASALEKKKSSRVDFRYANDGETGESNPPAPHPGLKAGSNK